MPCKLRKSVQTPVKQMQRHDVYAPEMMEQIKNEIIQVISKHMDIDMEGLDIQITQTESESNNGTVPALFVNIPIRDIRHGNS